MPEPTAPADAGLASNAATPAADAALASSPAAGGGVAPAAPTPTGGGVVGPEGNVAAAPVTETVLGRDGEPVPYGNEAQRMVANAIADSMRPAEEGGEAPNVDVNAQIKEISRTRQVQSTPGPTPAEIKPTVAAPETVAPKMAAKPEVKGKGTVQPPAAAQP